MYISSRRLGVYAVALGFAIVMNFTVPRLMPGSPVDAMIAQLGPRATPAAVEAIKARFGAVEAPLAAQFLDYLKGLATLDLGVSVKYYPQTVTEILARSTLWTLFLVVTAITFSLVVGTLLGAIAAWRRGGRFDTVVSPFSVVMIAVPPVIIALTALFVFGVSLRWFPVGYAYDPSLDPGINFTFAGSVFYHAILPVLTLAIPISAPLAQILMRNIDQVLAQPFVAVARAKGASRNWVLWRHVARNAIMPTLTIAGVLFGELLAGAVVTEAVFGLSGLGGLTYQAVGNHDTAVLQAIVVISALAFVTINLIVDLLYPVLDPRLGSRSGAPA